MRKETLHVYMGNLLIAEFLRDTFTQTDTLFGKPKVKIFSGREWFMTKNPEDELGREYQGEKMDYIFVSAEHTAKYRTHPGYKTDLAVIKEKIGKEDAKVVVLECRACSECNEETRYAFEDVITEFFKYYHYEDRQVLLERYFQEYLEVA